MRPLGLTRRDGGGYHKDDDNDGANFVDRGGNNSHRPIDIDRYPDLSDLVGG